MPDEIQRARAVDLATLKDRNARNAALDAAAQASDANRVSAKDPSYLVVEAVCPHDACVLQGYELADRLADGIGFVCPCDASRFDLAGRVLGGPAQTNLSVPRFTVLSPVRLRIG
jgi:Rieske Fe-S protein